MPLPFSHRAARTFVPVVLLSLFLSACVTTGGGPSNYATESFDSSTTHTRDFVASQAQPCEAARRALLSQGFFVNLSNDDQVSARKQFQPAGDVHVDVEFRVVCVPNLRQGRGSTAFATAVQDRYELKKSSNSASVGVGAIGSLSLPFSAGNDALIKVASQTVTEEEFYARFFVLLDEFLYVPPAAPPIAAPTAAPMQAPALLPALTPAQAPSFTPAASPAPEADRATAPALGSSPAPAPTPSAVSASPAPQSGPAAREELLPAAIPAPVVPDAVPVPLSPSRG